MSNLPKENQRNNPDTAEPQDIMSLLKAIKHSRAEGLPITDMTREDRRSVVVHLLDEGMPKVEIASLLGISNDTLWRDEKRIADSNKYGTFNEAIQQTAERINRRHDVLWSKAMRDKNYSLCLAIEKERLNALQSIGMIIKNPDKVSLDVTRTDEELANDVALTLDAIGLRIVETGEDEMQD
jgi:uncharacterized protein YjcR